MRHSFRINSSLFFRILLPAPLPRLTPHPSAHPTPTCLALSWPEPASWAVGSQPQGANGAPCIPGSCRRRRESRVQCRVGMLLSMHPRFCCMLCVAADLVRCFRLEYLKARKSSDAKTLPVLRTLLRPQRAPVDRNGRLLLWRRQATGEGKQANGWGYYSSCCLPSPAIFLGVTAGHRGKKGTEEADWWPLEAHGVVIPNVSVN